VNGFNEDYVIYTYMTSTIELLWLIRDYLIDGEEEVVILDELTPTELCRLEGQVLRSPG
jgi:hypothetical protein